MMLFTTPASRQMAAPAAASALEPAATVVDAIRDGAARSGVSFDYLLDTAKRESALDPTAKAPTSSAAGLFQFIESTWLGIVKSDGARYGLGAEADAIGGGGGSLRVEDAATRQAILKLREDPTVASAMAGELTRRNRDALATQIGREPTGGELYVAHLLGARGGSELIKAAARNPDRPAALDFPDAAAANRPIFYDRSGRARPTGEVYASLTATTRGGTVVTGEVGTSAAAPLPLPAAQTASGRAERPAILGLFQTEGRRGPLSEAVAKIWRVNAVPTTSKGAATAPFFPRTASLTLPDASETAVAPPSPVGSSSTAAAAPLVSPSLYGAALGIPLPPPRPSTVDTAIRGAPARLGAPLRSRAS